MATQPTTANPLNLHAYQARRSSARDRTIEDLSAPIRATKAPNVQPEQQWRNSKIIGQRAELRNSRTSIRVGFEGYAVRKTKAEYCRLPGTAVILNCPTPEQAEAAMVAIQAFAMSLDGKLLAVEEKA